MWLWKQVGPVQCKLGIANKVASHCISNAGVCGLPFGMGLPSYSISTFMLVISFFESLGISVFFAVSLVKKQFSNSFYLLT